MKNRSFNPLLRSLSARRFRALPLPPVLRNRSKDKPLVIVTLTAASVVAGMLDAFARLMGQNVKAVYGLPENNLSQDLHWVSLDDGESLRAILARRSEFALTCLSFFELRGPIYTNPSHRFGPLRLVSILLFGNLLDVGIGAPFEITSELSLPRFQRKLKVEFYRNLKVVRGTPFQSIQTQANLTLSGAEFERELAIIQTKQRVSRAKALSMARREFFAIAANPIRPFYSVAVRICRLITSRLFSQVITTGLEEFANASREHVVILVPVHRSHLDYILVGQKLYESKVNPPLVAAGVNLAFWPIGFFIRSLGAYFVRRSARHDRIHALVLRRYVTYLVKRGHAQEFFIEGGRSRSGKMRTPKLGLLSIMVDAVVKGIRKDLSFVPVSITYENVVEDKTFGDENSGKAKEKESLRSLLKVPAIFKKSYGEVMIAFGQPLLLSDVAAASGTKETRNLAREVAQSLTYRIQTQTNPSLTAMIYTALMCAPRYGLTRSDLITQVQGLAQVAAIAREIDPLVGVSTPSLERFLAGYHGALSDIARGGVVQRGHVLNEEVYFIPGTRRFTADFYKNSLIHLFLPNAIFGVLHLMQKQFRPEDGSVFHEILKADLMLPAREVFIETLAKWSAKLAERGIFVKNGDGSFSIVDCPAGFFLPTLLSGSVEAVLWAMANISQLAGPDQKIGFKPLMAQLQNDYRTAGYLSLANRTEGSSQSSLQSALEILSALGVISLQSQGSSGDEVTVLKSHSTEIDFLREAQKAISRWESARPEKNHQFYNSI